MTNIDQGNINMAESNFNLGSQRAESLENWHPQKLRLVLNQSRFIYYIKGDEETALELAKNTFISGMNDIDDRDDISEELYNDSIELLKKLDNFSQERM